MTEIENHYKIATENLFIKYGMDGWTVDDNLLMTGKDEKQYQIEFIGLNTMIINVQTDEEICYDPLFNKCFERFVLFNFH